MKKKIAIIMAAVVVITSVLGFSIYSLGATRGTSGSLEWNLDTSTGVFTVSGSGYGANYNYAVNEPWYSNRDKITTVVVSEGVQALGDNWFNGCSKITSITLPNTMVKLGANCFKSCTSLTGVELPSNCTEIYGNVFSGCTNLLWAVLPEDSSSSTYSHIIPDGMFYGCSKLKQVMVGEGFTGIDKNAFYNCGALSGIVWRGSAISSIGNNALNKANSSLTFVGDSIIQGDVQARGYSYQEYSGSCGNAINYSYDVASRALVFTGEDEITSCPWSKYSHLIKSIDFGKMTGVCDNAFANCTEVGDELVLGEDLYYIGSRAFENASYHFVTMRSDFVSISGYAFDSSKQIAFYGVHDSGLYDYVLAENSPNWSYYCLNNNHVFPTSPNENGEIVCDYCQRVAGKNSVTERGGHNYKYQAVSKGILYYTCRDCGIVDHEEKINDVIDDFPFVISSYADSVDYDGRFDIVRDGYINAKDYAVLVKMRRGIYTDYDMTLTNENATKRAQQLYAYICSTYKNAIITGQQESTWKGDDYEFKYIKQNTGKEPAIRGFDFMNDDFYGCVNRAKAWHNKGGIVTICWHCSSNFDQSYDACKADKLTQDQWDKMLTPGTEENRKTLAAMDKAGNALLQLQEAGIPVLWRPFHEFDGDWFWWGKGGSENFKKLWIMMYNHFTNDLGLNNLIWVLGYCHNGTDYGTNLADWYPGNQYCDIVGADSYEVSTNGAEKRLFDPVFKASKGLKPMALHETGKIPTIDQFRGVPWAFFMTWHTNYITDENTKDDLYNIYNSDYAITLDELPNIYE